MDRPLIYTGTGSETGQERIQDWICKIIVSKIAGPVLNPFGSVPDRKAEADPIRFGTGRFRSGRVQT